jgi:class 3 adenylate cyclase
VALPRATAFPAALNRQETLLTPLHSAPASASAARTRSGSLLESFAATALAAVAAPSIILYRLSEMVLPADAGVRMPARRSLLDEIEQIVSGTRPRRSSAARALATVMFTDIVGSTERASQLGDSRWRDLLEAHDVSVRWQVAAHGGHVVKSLGDGYLATFDSPASAIRCGRALTDDAESLGVEIKAGIHTGECELMGDDVAGMAVHIAARVVGKAAPGEVLATSAVRDLVVGSVIAFAERGAHELKGVPGEWSLLAVEHAASALAAT